MAYKGFFKPKNKHKYIGDPSNIIYRSRWELLLMSYLDNHQDVIEWGSEEFFIRYKSPIDGSDRRYYPDFYVKKKTKDGKQKTVVIEVKPYKETIEPKVQKRKTKKYIKEVTTYGVNQAKWKAAEAFCEERGWEFLIFTEYELGLEEKKKNVSKNV